MTTLARPTTELLSELDEHNQYMLIRLIDCCLRENIRNITTESEVINASQVPTEIIALHSDFEKHNSWLHIKQAFNDEVLLPVQACVYMQPWRAVLPRWVLKQNGQWRIQHSTEQWLTLLSQGMKDVQRKYYEQFLVEFDCAVEQRHWAQTQRLPELGSVTSGWPAMRDLEQLAAHRDHPFYPTARAKSGLSAQHLTAYAPEAMNEFELAWLAVPKALCHGNPIIFTPSFAEVGLHSVMGASHQLVPVHPLTAETYWSQQLDDLNRQLKQDYSLAVDIVIAPKTFLRVRPTLSVRTVSLIDAPNIHIKLPLLMRSLGYRNLRLVDPKTLADGFVFQTILQDIEETDPLLKNTFDHCDEKQGGNVDNRSDLSWIIRRYPEHLGASTIACVASFLGADEQGTFVIQSLAKRFYHDNLDDLLADYIRLQLKIHLTLWLKHGIALESNQQNCMVVFNKNKPLKVLFRDNDSGRMRRTQYLAQHPDNEALVNQFCDQRIFVDDDKSLMQMFMTITLQLDITAIIDGLADAKLIDANSWYQRLGAMITEQLAALSGEGINTQPALQALFNEAQHYIKYLLLSGSLLSKEESGAADINKYYGFSSPNPWFDLDGNKL